MCWEGGGFEFRPVPRDQLRKIGRVFFPAPRFTAFGFITIMLITIITIMRIRANCTTAPRIFRSLGTPKIAYGTLLHGALLLARMCKNISVQGARKTPRKGAWKYDPQMFSQK